MKKKLKIFWRCQDNANNGIGYYRFYLPLKQLEKKGLIEFRHMTFNFGGKPVPDTYTEEQFKNMGKWCDIMYFSRNDHPTTLSTIAGLREYFKKPAMVDIDDNCQHVRPHNPGYQSYFYGSLGHVMNLKGFELYDGVTVSTKNLKDFYSQWFPKDHMYVCPNSLDMNIRSYANDLEFTSDLYEKKPGEIRIGWTGSSSHWENLKHIEPAVLAILKQYPQTTFYYTGLFGDLFKGQPKDVQDRIHQVTFVTVYDYPSKIKEMNLDVGLAPLCDNYFDRAKSNLRCLEYMSMKVPVVASRVEPYLFLKEEVDGLLATEVDEWYDKIEDLVQDRELRNDLIKNGYERMWKEFNIEKNDHYWLDAFRHTLETYKEIQKKRK